MVPDECEAIGDVRAMQGHARDLDAPFVPEPYAFTDTEGPSWFGRGSWHRLPDRSCAHWLESRPQPSLVFGTAIAFVVGGAGLDRLSGVHLVYARHVPG